MNLNSKEKWEIPAYSDTQIAQAGKTILDSTLSPDDHTNALEILNNWRASHAYPLHVITSKLRRDNKNAIVAQRLKRIDSILGELKQIPTINPYKIQDLGGCRVIMDNVEDVYTSLNKYKSSRVRHILKREDDYIKTPKPSGYRSYHMVYEFHSDDKDTYNNNIMIEIQFRTKLQHIWATAVEMMGIHTKTALKTSSGNEDILRFFTLVSSIFALQEGTPVCPDTSNSYDELVKEIKAINAKLNIMSQLNTLSVSIQHAENNNWKNGYYILTLDHNQKNLKIDHFNPSQIEIATTAYDQIEATKDPDIDTVLTGASSFDDLRIAYPNYFGDIRDFVSIVGETISHK